jgi:hypothetical protein
MLVVRSDGTIQPGHGRHNGLSAHQPCWAENGRTAPRSKCRVMVDFVISLATHTQSESASNHPQNARSCVVTPCAHPKHIDYTPSLRKRQGGVAGTRVHETEPVELENEELTLLAVGSQGRAKSRRDGAWQRPQARTNTRILQSHWPSIDIMERQANHANLTSPRASKPLGRAQPTRGRQAQGRKC